MSNDSHVLRRRLALLLTTSLCATASLPLWAADSPLPTGPTDSLAAATPADPLAPRPLADLPAVAAPAATTAPSQNVTINLINRLVQRGVLTKEDSTELIKLAEADAAKAREQAAVAAPAPDDAVHVTYIPEIVKAQMRDEIKQEVMTQARDENWASPRLQPDWITRIKLFGDIRTRYEGDFFPSHNATGFSNLYWNYNAINQNSTPYDYKSNVNPPYNNANQDRNRIRLRARFGADVDLGEGFTSGIRFATGENNSPVTESQSLGAASSTGGGNFSKYAIWLDRAFIKYELGGQPERDLTFTVGRFDNPFFATSMLWADDLGFDGAVVQGKYQVSDATTSFLTLGGFPVFNTDFNFSSTQPNKFSSEDKWLIAIQGGVDRKINSDFSTKIGIAYYDFVNIEGKVSDPFIPLSNQDQGSTDDSRPAFAQRGNTYIALRDIVPNSALNSSGNTNQWQYFGLATPFHELAITARMDYSHFDPVHVALVSEVVNNLAFDRNAINHNGPANLQGPVNNFSLGTSKHPGTYDGGNTGWIMTLKVGNVALEKLWDWNAAIGYRYVESDATVDGFCDADFGLGGTNLKGITISGAVALSPRVWLNLRWMSADSIAGPTFNTDIIQLDLNAKF